MWGSDEDWGATASNNSNKDNNKPNETSGGDWVDWGDTASTNDNKGNSKPKNTDDDWGNTASISGTKGTVKPSVTPGGDWGDWGDTASTSVSKGNSKPNDTGGDWGDTPSTSFKGNTKSNETSKGDWGGWGDTSTNSNTSKSNRDNTWSSDRPSHRSNNRFSNKDGDNANNAEEGEKRPEPYKPKELDLEEEAKLQADGTGENFGRYKDQKVTCLPKDSIQPINKFEDVIESELLLKNVKTLNYQELTPIQKWAMPAIVKGYDIIGCAQTGSGKTAAFLLPILQNILKINPQNDPNDDCKNPYCLIISPTRELARQIYIHAEMLSRDSIVKSCVIYGQIATMHLRAQLSRGCDVLVATLGRLKDFVERGWIGFKNIKYVVLDEGDRLVDEGFTGDIQTIFNHPTMPSKEDRQILFFSATFKKEVQSNARQYLKDSFIFLTVGRIGAANEDIRQEFLEVVKREDKKRELKKILESVPQAEKTIIFTQTKALADTLAGLFSAWSLPAVSIHGDRHQYQREEAINLFKRGERRFLISSPVGNRGLDLPKVSLVINYDLPDCIDEYVHRIGRTGRAGHTGRAISFYDKTRDTELLPELLRILGEAKQEIPDWLKNNDVFSGAPGGGADEDWGGSGANETGNDNWTTAAAEDDWGSSGTSTANHSKVPAAYQEDDWGSSGTSAADNNRSKPREDDWDASSSSKKRPAPDHEGNPTKKFEPNPPKPNNDDWW